MADTLNAGGSLNRGDSLSVGSFSLTLQDDGNLVLIDGGQPVWASDTAGQGVERAELQNDGNFVLYAGGDAKWASNTSGDGAKLVLQSDRNVVLYIGDDARWSTSTTIEPAVAEPIAEPAAPPVEEAPPAPPAPRTYTVEPGDTLWAISERFYGDGNRYLEIASASGIDNPDLINVGQVLTIP